MMYLWLFPKTIVHLSEMQLFEPHWKWKDTENHICIHFGKLFIERHYMLLFCLLFFLFILCIVFHCIVYNVLFIHYIFPVFSFTALLHFKMYWPLNLLRVFLNEDYMHLDKKAIFWASPFLYKHTVMDLFVFSAPVAGAPGFI